MILRDYVVTADGFFHVTGGARLRTILMGIYSNQAEAAGLRRRQGRSSHQ